MSEVIDNAQERRFELHEAAGVAFADYVRSESLLILPHVEAPPALRGTAAAGRLMRGVLEIARAQGLKVSPTCGYADAFMRRHREWDDLRE